MCLRLRAPEPVVAARIDRDPGNEWATLTDAPAELPEALADLRDRDPDDLRPSGYVVDTLAAALYHGLGTSSLEAAVVDAVNMGGDPDTVGAVAGVIGGARFATSDVPDRDVRLRVA